MKKCYSPPEFSFRDRLFTFMKVEGDRVIEIGRSEETISIPTTARYIGQLACFNCIISSLNLEVTNIIIIEEYAFAHCYQLEAIIFPSCLQEICEGAFCSCYDLKIINFGSGSKLTKIGPKAFHNCHSIKKIEFPPLLETISDSAFNSNHNWNHNFDLRNTKVQQIGLDAFGFESNLYISLPATVTAKSILNCYKSEIYIVESHRFAKRDECGCLFVNGTIMSANKRIRRFLVRRGVERIGKYCFCESNLVSLTIPSSVTKLSKYAFYHCKELKFVSFTKNSRLKEIGRMTFGDCESLKSIKFPKSLISIKCFAFFGCRSLKNVTFTNDSHLERIENAFTCAKIKQLSLPPSIREIDGVCNGLNELESVYVRNEFFKSNKDRTAIFSHNGKELICVIPSLEDFKIPDGVRIIRKNAFHLSKLKKIFIPSSVEIIEKNAFDCDKSIIEFAARSRLTSLDFNAFSQRPKGLIINNKNFVTKDDGVVISLNPRGIVFVPNNLTEIKIDPNIEVIYSDVFDKTEIRSLHFPKSLKKIFSCALYSGMATNRSITFEEGTDLESVDELAFGFFSCLENFSIRINGKLYRIVSDVLELPPDVPPEHLNLMFRLPRSLKNGIICPRSSLLALVKKLNFAYRVKFEIIENQ